MMKLLIVVFVLFLIGGLGAWVWSDKAQVRQVWNTAPVDRGEIKVRITASGTVEPRTLVQVGSQVSGKIKQVYVEPDQRVKAGQTLATIDTELLEADVRDTQINLKRMQASVAMLEIEQEALEVKRRQLELSQTQQTIVIQRSEASLELAEKTLQRYIDLAAVDAATVNDIDINTLQRDNARRDLQLAKAKLDEFRLNLQQLANEARTLDARKTQALLDIERTASQLEKVQANLAYATIVSPMDGIVLSRAVQPGQTIAAQFQTPNLFEIVSDLQTVRIASAIDEAEVGALRQGQRVNFQVDAFPLDSFEGSIAAVRLKHELRANLVTYPVVIEAKNPASDSFPNGKLRPGMTAYLEIEIETKREILRVPVAALRFTPPEKTIVLSENAKLPELEPKQVAVVSTTEEAQSKPASVPEGFPATLYTTDEERRLKAVKVRVGVSDGEFYELLSGELKPGDEVAIGSKTVLEASGESPKGNPLRPRRH